jgi:hypothetical protein
MAIPAPYLDRAVVAAALAQTLEELTWTQDAALFATILTLGVQSKPPRGSVR